MKTVFAFVSTIFFISGCIVISMLIGSMINTGLVKLVGVHIHIPASLMVKFIMPLFSACGVTALLTFPAILTNVLVRMFQEKNQSRKDRNWSVVVALFFLILVCAIIVQLTVNEHYKAAGFTLTVLLVGTLIGSGGEEHPFWLIEKLEKISFRQKHIHIV